MVTGELPPLPRWDPGVIAGGYGPEDTCLSTEGSVDGVEHPIGSNPVAPADVRFDGRWYAVRGFLDIESPRPSLCDVPVAGGCSPDAAIEVVSTSSLRSPAVDEMQPGRWDGVFVVRTDTGGRRRVFDVTIVQRLDWEALKADRAQQPWPYLTQWVGADPPASLPLLHYVVGHGQQFGRRGGGYRLVLADALLVTADITGERCRIEAVAPRIWHVSGDVDFTGVFHHAVGETLSPHAVADLVGEERPRVGGQVQEDGTLERLEVAPRLENCEGTARTGSAGALGAPVGLAR